MGYTHNWTIKLPPQRQQEALQAIEIDLRSRFSESMAIEMDDDGILNLYSLDGSSEGFSIGPVSETGHKESCKTGRGLAELVIAELLWRTSDCVYAHGGEMVITSDWTSASSMGTIDYDAKVALAVLALRCADLIKEQTLEVKAIPRAWPCISQFRDFAVEERYMRRNRATKSQITKWASEPEQMVFGIEPDGAVNYAERHTPGTLRFDFLVTKHIQAARQQQAEQQVVRGFCYSDLAVYLAERQIAGKVPSTDPVIRNNTRSLTGLVPQEAWLAEVVRERMEEEAQEA